MAKAKKLPKKPKAEAKPAPKKPETLPEPIKLKLGVSDVEFKDNRLVLQCYFGRQQYEITLDTNCPETAEELRDAAELDLLSHEDEDNEDEDEDNEDDDKDE